MATLVELARDRGGRQRILEGLWMIGIEPHQLAVDPAITANDFLAQLRAKGVHDQFLNRAAAGVQWRAGDAPRGTVVTKVMDLLRASGYRDDEVSRFMNEAKGKDERGVMDVLTRQFNERTAGAMMFKATGGRSPDGAVWNPYRTDVPPNNANLKHGAGGMAAGVLPPGWSGVEGSPDQVAQNLPPGTRPPSRNERAGVPHRPGTRPAGAPPLGPAQIAGLPGSGQGSGIGAALGAGGGGGAPPAYVDTTPPPRTPEEKIAYVKRHYGANAWYLDIPEVRDMLMQAAADEVSLDELGNRLAETTWWKVTDANARTWYAQERADPASAIASVTKKSNDVNTLASRLGVTIDPARARQIAESALRYGWDETEMRMALSTEMLYDPTEMQGAAVQKLKEKAADYFLPLSDEQVRKWGKDLVSGIVAEEEFDHFLKEQAKGWMPSLSASIDRGLTVKQVADQFYNHAADMLGINREAIDFKDPKWLAPLNAIDPKGERRMMTMEEWETKLRTDPKYGFSKTQKAKDEAVGLADQIAVMFGAKAV